MSMFYSFTLTLIDTKQASIDISVTAGSLAIVALRFQSFSIFSTVSVATPGYVLIGAPRRAGWWPARDRLRLRVAGLVGCRLMVSRGPHPQSRDGAVRGDQDQGLM